MQLQQVGYFPKQTSVPEGWGGPAHVSEICSVSHCIATAPPQWIEAWRHNELGFFDTIADALSVLPAHASGFHTFAYSILPVFYVAGTARDLVTPPLPVQPLPGDFESLGFDAVSKDLSSFFECSPLSCNGEHARFSVNSYCLFSTIEEAVAGAQAWSTGGAEPGDYYILEVFRSKSTTGA